MVSRVLTRLQLTGGTLFGSRLLCSKQVCVEPDDERVQELMLRMTGMDLDKVFAPRKEPLCLPKYKLMTLEELEKAHLEMEVKAAQLLRMPPVVPKRTPRGEVIKTDNKLDKATEHRIIFTDTSQHKEIKERRIVVRETDGALREASWEERDRMCQVFFPVLGRQMWLPPVLTSEGIGRALKSNFHVNVLDRVCLQCEPDSEDYIRVHRTVYEDIHDNRLYDLLRSTKYFGTMVWYLVTEESIYNLLEDMLNRELYSDATDLVSLYRICFSSPLPEPPQKKEDVVAELQYIKVFCEDQGLTDVLGLVKSIEYKLTNSPLTSPTLNQSETTSHML